MPTPPRRRARWVGTTSAAARASRPATRSAHGWQVSWLTDRTRPVGLPGYAPVALRRAAFRLQLREQLRLWGKPRTAFPFHLPNGRTIGRSVIAGHPRMRQRRIGARAFRTPHASCSAAPDPARAGTPRGSVTAMPAHGSISRPHRRSTTKCASGLRSIRHGGTRAGSRSKSRWIWRARWRRPAARPVLVDCLTLWLSNLMLGEHDIARPPLTALDAALDRASARRPCW